MKGRGLTLVARAALAATLSLTPVLVLAGPAGAEEPAPVVDLPYFDDEFVSEHGSPPEPPPTAVDDAYVGDQDALIDGRDLVYRSVLDNDVHHWWIDAVLVSAPTHGTLDMDSGGGFVYTPDPGFHGADTFTYMADDGFFTSNVATVTLTIRPAERALVGTPDVYVASAGVELVVAAPGILENDRSPDGLPLTVAALDVTTVGQVDVNVDGSFTYTSTPGFEGPDSFTYIVTDGLARSGRVMVTFLVVGSGPEVVDDAYVLDEDTTLAAGSVLANDVGQDGRPLTAAKLTDPASGVLSLAPDGAFTYTPEAGFHGTDCFTYEASDGATVSAPATVTLTVTAVDDAPSFDLPVVALVAVEDTPLTGGVTAVNTDGLALRYSATITGAPAGSVVMDASTGAFTFTPAPDFAGLAQVDVRACETSGRCAAQRLDITVTSLPDAPVATDSTVRTTWGKAVKGTFVVSDVDSSTLTFAVTSAPRRGSVAVDQAARTFVYTPAWWSTGDDSFVVRVCDPEGRCDSARVTVDLRRSWWMPSPVVVRSSWIPWVRTVATGG